MKNDLWPKWETLTPVEVKNLWPNSLVEDDCEIADSKNSEKCLLMTHKGYYEGWCKCCYTFNFHRIPSQDGSYLDNLRSFIIFHTELSFDDTVHAAQRLLSSIRELEGGSDPDVSDWRVDENGTLTKIILWDTPASDDKVLAKAINLKIYRSDAQWTLYMVVSKEQVKLNDTK